MWHKSIDTMTLSPKQEHRPFSEHFGDWKLNKQSPFNFRAQSTLAWMPHLPSTLEIYDNRATRYHASMSKESNHQKDSLRNGARISLDTPVGLRHESYIQPPWTSKICGSNFGLETLKKENNILLTWNEGRWRIKWHVIWLRWGDQNITFFHK